MLQELGPVIVSPNAVTTLALAEPGAKEAAATIAAAHNKVSLTDTSLFKNSDAPGLSGHRNDHPKKMCNMSQLIMSLICKGSWGRVVRLGPGCADRSWSSTLCTRA